MSQANPVNMTPVITGTSRFLGGTVDATGTAVLAVDKYRVWGVLVQNVDTVATDGLLVGSTTGDAVLVLAALGNATNSPNTVFVPGTGSVFLKSSNGTLTTAYALMYL